MKKLSKVQNTELQTHLDALAEKKTAIETAWEEFEEKHGALAEAIGEYNLALASVIEWRDGIIQEMSDYQAERSDKWQEGDAGQAYQEWIDEWEGLDLTEIEVPELGEMPEPDHIETIEQVPTEVSA